MSPGIVDGAPSVSIVLPTYNGSLHLDRSLESCLGQTWKDFEVIVVVDGSTDNTRTILNRYDDPRLRIIDRAQNRGLPESLNEGFDQCRGKWLTWTSDDNEYLSTAIEKMVGALTRHPEADLVYTSYAIVDALGNPIRQIRTSDPGTVWQRNTVGACFLYTRRLAQVTGPYRPERRLIEDYDFWLRAHRHFRFTALDEVLYLYRDHPTSLSARLNAFARERAVARLKREHRGISRLALQQELARIDIAEAFALSEQGRPIAVPGLVLRGVIGNPRFLANRGVLSIGFRSVAQIARGHR